MPAPYDIAFLGGGPAGYQGAIRAAQLGARVAVVEQNLLGGVCLNWGCIPTKAVRASAEAGRFIRRAKEFGFTPVEASPQIAAVIARKERIVAAVRASVERLFAAHRIDLVEGRGRLTAPGRIEVEKDGQLSLVEAGKVVVATGSRPARLPLFPRSPRVSLADEMLNITYLPRHLLVVGGGAVGVEMAAIFGELGSQVSLVEALPRLLPADDAETAEYMAGVLRRRKVKVICGARIEAVEEKEGFTVRLADGSVLAPDTVLVAVGRRLNTEAVGLEELGVEMERGRIVVGEHMQTNVPSLYAAGDVTGGWLLAHVAFAEGICAAEHALGQPSRMDYRVVPRCIFTLPEYGAVGLSEEEARARHPVKVARFPFKSLGMAQALGELEGLVKIIAHAKTDEILGAHIIGPRAADLVAELALAMRAGLPSRAAVETIHAHPTLSEAVFEAAQALRGQAIHIPPEGAA
jgi:dihydrolipoamide dehydrogenase